MTALSEISVDRADGSATNLGEFAGKVVLVVNVASACGLTPQYTALESTFEKYADKGLVVVGFPCNDFGGQEPGTQEEIQTFCTSKYDVKFPIMKKLSVKPGSRHPLYEALIAAQPTAIAKAGSDFREKMKGYGIEAGPGEILWNFEKFLVDRTGKVVARFTPDTTPDDPIVVAAIEKALG